MHESRHPYRRMQLTSILKRRMSAMWKSRAAYEWVTSHMHKSRHPYNTRWIQAAHCRDDTTWYVPYEWVMSHVYESRHPYRWIQAAHCRGDTPNRMKTRYTTVVSHMNESGPIWMSHVPYVWVTAPIQMDAVSTLQRWHTKQDEDTIHYGGVSYEWVTSHMNESRPIWMRHRRWMQAAHCRDKTLKEDDDTINYGGVSYEWVTSHVNESRPIWMSHVPYEWGTCHMNESRPIWMSHESLQIDAM